MNECLRVTPGRWSCGPAGGVAVHEPSDPTYKSDVPYYLYTSSEDGRTVWHWKVDRFGVALWEHETHVGSHNVTQPIKAQRDARYPQRQDPAPSADIKTPGRGASGGKNIPGVVIPGGKQIPGVIEPPRGNKIPGVVEPLRAKKTSAELAPTKN